MKVVIQRSIFSEVVINNESCGKVNSPNLLCLVGFGKEDTEFNLETCLNKIINLRIFSNSEGRFDKSLLDVSGCLYLVPQFTLYADTSKGRRPEFFNAMHPDLASPLFTKLVLLAKNKLGQDNVKAGIFGEDMKVSLINDGPVTIILDF